MSVTLQIFPLSEVQERANDSDASINLIEIVSGHVYPGQRGAKLTVLTIRRNADGSWPARSFLNLEKYNGQYTAYFKPGKEVLFLDSAADDEQLPFNYSQPMQGWMPGQNAQAGNKYQGKDLLELVQILMQQEATINQLQAQVKELQEDLQQFETTGDKFSYALQGVFERAILPLIMPAAGNPVKQTTTAQPMNGTETTDWTKYPIRDQGDEGVQDAMTILYEAFGAENLVRIAGKLQQQPNLVQTLTNML